MLSLPRTLADDSRGQAIARRLLEIGALRFSPEAPFTWSSGLRAPVYCDNRLVLSYPSIRRELRDAFLALIRTASPDAGAVCGIATGAIALGALVAEALELPFLYVRPKAKSHGLGNQVEGRLQPGVPIVVIEDLVSTGGSSLEAIQALRAVRGEVRALLAIFTYGFEEAWQSFEENDIPFTPMCDLKTLLSVAEADGLLVPSVIDSIRRWGENPSEWEG